MAQTLTAPTSKAEQAPARFTTPTPRQKTEKMDLKKLILDHTPTTDIIERLKKCKPGDNPTINITKEMALDLLTLNDIGQNRKVITHHLDHYVKTMKENNWKYTGDTYKVTKLDKNGDIKLIDAQHRLLSIYLSGKTQKCLFATNLDEDAFAYIDIGKNRSAKDIVTINNFGTNATGVAYAIKNLILYKEQSKLASSVSAETVPTYKVNEWMQNEEEASFLANSIIFAKTTWCEKCQFFTAPQWGVLYYILWNLPGQQKKATEFLDQLANGNDLKSNDPIFVCRKALENFEQFIKNKKRKTVHSGIFALKVKFVIEAWNKKINGEKVTELNIDKESPIIPKPRYR